MSREILFRAKKKDNNEWVEGFYVKFYSNGKAEENHMIFSTNKENKSSQPYDIGPQTVCQYTGLSDKNGAKIFDGDILMCNGNKKDLAKAVFGKFYVIDAETFKKIDEVIGWHYEVIPTDYISKREPFNLSMPLTDMCIKRCEMEVIGNIYDNQWLLKQ